MLGESRKILIFTTAFRPMTGGSEIAIENITRRLPGFSFDIVTPRHQRVFKKNEKEGNLNIWRLGFGRNFDKYLFPILGFLKARKLLKKQRYDFIHAFQASYGAGAAWLLKIFNPDPKFILTLQEGNDLENQNFWLKFFRRLIIKKADIITGISNYLVDYAKIINQRARFLLIPNGVDAAKFKNHDFLPPTGGSRVRLESFNLKKEIGLKEDNRIVISISRLVPKNGLPDLVSAIEIVSRQIPEVRLIIIGNGPQRDGLKALIKNFKLEDKVFLLGEINHENLPRFLDIADVFVRPSLSEGLGNAFLEAMAAGVPIIGTPVGGIPDFLEDGRTGLFCRPKDPADLAEKIVNILTLPELKKMVVQNARDSINSKYDWQIVASKFANLYEN